MDQHLYNEILLRFLYPWILRVYRGRCYGGTLVGSRAQS
jgi:hypothetical protein